MRFDPKTRRALSLVSGLGFSIAFCLGLSILAGVWIDNRLHTRPVFLLVGILVGFFAAGSILYGLVKPRREDRQPTCPGNGNEGHQG